MEALLQPRTRKKRAPRQKTASSDFFQNPNNPRPKNRLHPLKTQQGNATYTYKIASGRPYWPSRDPIGEEGGVNLYGFVRNNGVNRWDILGLSGEHSVPRGRIKFKLKSTASRIGTYIGRGDYGKAIAVGEVVCSDSGKPLSVGMPRGIGVVYGKAGLFQNMPSVEVDIKSPFTGASTTSGYGKVEEAVFIVIDFKTSTDTNFASYAFPLVAAPGLSAGGSVGVWIGGAIAGIGNLYDKFSGASDADRHILEFKCECIEDEDRVYYKVHMKHTTHSIFHEEGLFGFEVNFIDTKLTTK